MDTPGDERVTVSYEVMAPVYDTGDKPKALKVRKDFKLAPGTGAHLRIKTPYDDPFVMVSVQTADPGARATVKDVLKGTVEVVVCGTIRCNATLLAYIVEGGPESVW